MKNKIVVFSSLLILVIGIVLISNIRKPFNLEDKYYGNSNLIISSKDDVEKVISNKESVLIYAFTGVCSLKTPCEEIFREAISDINISMLSANYNDIKNIKAFKNVKYGPSVIIVKKGKVVSFLDANNSKDMDKYQDKDKFITWLEKYINIKKVN